jgi:RHS repeat-associated protein
MRATASAADTAEQSRSHLVAAPAVSLPKGGGAVRGLGEKFGANPVNGTGSLTIPIPTSPGRSGFGPQLALSYDSGSGNGPFGFGWNLSLPAVTRKTDKGLPRYCDEPSDVFVLSGAEDLVPKLEQNNAGEWVIEETTRTVDGIAYVVRDYRPRIEGLFARIECWTSRLDPADVFWRSLSPANITTWYGKTSSSRITDPDRPARIFSWLICESHDDKGNAIQYEYKPENSDGVDLSAAHERNRTTATRGTNRYLKRLRYGNRNPYFADPAGRLFTPLPDDWLFEAVFDYGEHDPAIPLPGTEPSAWTLRHDPFSMYRAGFEVRTYRLCQRVLMFHHFPEQLGTQDCLVRSTDFSYSSENEPDGLRTPPFAFVSSVTPSGYARLGDGSYLKKSLPPLEFEYSKPTIGTDVKEVDDASLENLPIGLDGATYQWVDLHGEGLPGILSEHAGALYYKRNLSPASVSSDAEPDTATVALGSVERVPDRPSILALSGSRQQWLDLAGDGQLDLVDFAGPVPGFYERTEADGWEPFRPFASQPHIDWSSPNLRFVDLTGDGRADLLITDDEAFCWYPSLGEAGFAQAEKVWHALDEERGPRVLLADGTQSLSAADMNGDGLNDLVRIRNGEICYWPSLGYGRFGAKVTMDNAPWFDHPDHFDQRRVRTADIDGSGTTDIIYLAEDGVDIYFNESGNGWSGAERLAAFPAIDDISAIQVSDLLGNGTACLVWSSPLVGHARRPMRYVDLMGGQKPHLLVTCVNNLGAETRIEYAPSTRFYLADKLDGKPWITRLPFPVHVVERTETYDHISGNRFVTRYAYHHGYFDGVEREFRGFAMVEQWDTEELAALSESTELPVGTNVDQSSHIPPVLTRTWFHTGVYQGRDRISNLFDGLLDDTILPAGLTVDEEREACRALKGAMLRQEVYALDGTDNEAYPYIVTEQNVTIRLLQPRADNLHSVFFTHPREAVSAHYERNLSDPRISHALTLEVDDFGNVLKSVAIGYGRLQPDTTLSADDQVRQADLLATCTENTLTNSIDLDDAHRTPLTSESRTYELTRLVLTAGESRATFDEVVSAVASAPAISYEEMPDTGRSQKRLIENVRTLYRPNDLGTAEGDALALLALGQLESLALPGESYKLAFTPGLVARVYGGRVTDAMLGTDGRYVHSNDDTGWWIPSGRIFLSPGTADDPATELAHAREHFFLPHRFRDPFHSAGFETEGVVAYDVPDLFVRETRDALANIVAAVHDYRVLQPRLITDANGNRGEAAFDALGQVVGTAIMGKDREGKGDSLDGFVADLDDATTLAHLQNPLTDPHALLQQATTRLVYDLFAYQRTRDAAQPQPAVVYTLARETHEADLQAGERTNVQHAFSYSDGFGREIQKKVQAEPGPLVPGGAEVSPRWVGSGWTIFNNKGKPVRQYEPFFSGTHGFEFARTVGVSPVLFYDPIGRVVATLHPNHTWERVVFDPWRQETWDVNDTVLIADPRDVPAVSDYFSRLPDAEYLPGWHAQRAGGAMGVEEQAAATRAAVHANTPGVAHMDSLGRTFLTVAHNRFQRSNASPEEAFHSTRVVYDIEGNQRDVIDALDRIVMRYDYDMLGGQVYSTSMEAGERWMLNDAAGKPLYGWNSRDHRLRTTYDALRRPTEVHLQEGGGAELLVARTVYGESQTNAEASNLRGKPYQAFDGAGVVTTGAYDFKGNLLSSSRQLAADYKSTPDWSAAVALEAEVFSTSTSFDALNRPVTLTTPDDSVIRPTYNEANLLNAVDANLRGEALNGQPVWTRFITNIDYSAKGQRERIEYGNSVSTTYEYDPLAFRLIHLQTLRGSERLQDLFYTYDPAGNITHISDEAQQTIYFRNRRVDASSDYTYDAINQLIEASGREHLGQAGNQPNPPTAPGAFNEFHTQLDHPGNGDAMGLYQESYVYDLVGNILEMQHRGMDPAHPGWTRTYVYDEASLIDGEEHKMSNRLSSTQVGGGDVEPYTYDAHGSMTSMLHLSLMRWNYVDQLGATSSQAVATGTPETTYYVYDGTGQRVRKVTEGQAAAGGTARRVKERLYLGGFEIYREYDTDGSTVTLERETLHVMDGQQRVALVESRTQGNDGSPARLTRYQLGNHLGSASLELSEAGEVVSYEEHYPYGSTSYQAIDAGINAAAKRYRYTGMERDAETGLAYHGARYYAGWLGRWVSSDPIGMAAGVNGYVYSQESPTRFTDRTGHSGNDEVDAFAQGLATSIGLATRSSAASSGAIVEMMEQHSTDIDAGGISQFGGSKYSGDDPVAIECGCTTLLEVSLDAYFHAREEGVRDLLGAFRTLPGGDAQRLGLQRAIGDTVATSMLVGMAFREGDERGTAALRALHDEAGWTTVYFHTGEPDDSVGGYQRVAETRLYPALLTPEYRHHSEWQAPIDFLIDNLSEDPPTQDAMSQHNLEQLKTVPFAVGVVNAGTHTFVLSYGVVFEVHWAEGPRDKELFEASRLEDFMHGWTSGAVAFPSETLLDRKLTFTEE